jgi:hypothetical protein
MKKQRKEKERENEWNMQDLWDITKRPNLWIMNIEKEVQAKEIEKMLCSIK